MSTAVKCCKKGSQKQAKMKNNGVKYCKKRFFVVILHEKMQEKVRL